MKGANTNIFDGALSANVEVFTKNDQEIFNQLIKNSFDMIVLMNDKGSQTFVSKSCEGILGFTPDELINIPVIDEMIHPDDKEKVRQGYLDIIENGTHGGTQYRHLHKDGHWVYLEAFGNNLLHDPQIESIVLNVRDVTDRKLQEIKLRENEARFRELNATKDRLISIIGHDLRNPFNTIIGFSELLLDDIKNNQSKDLEQYARIINDSSHKVNELLTNLLTWSRTQTNRIQFKPEEFILEHVLEDVKSLLQDMAVHKSINIKVPETGEHQVTADMDMVHTILRNLISNGIKFTPKGGSISVDVSSTDDETMISVKDNGVGMNDEKLRKLFKIDSMETTTGTRGEKGTGFGLLLVKEFVNKHDGEVWVKKNAAKGVTFKFTLPS